MKIILDKEKCIGCGSCAAVCPDHFEMGSDGKAHLKDSSVKSGEEIKEIKEEDCSGQARDICPVNVIKIIK